jgi:hypothetical protein
MAMGIDRYKAIMESNTDIFKSDIQSYADLNGRIDEFSARSSNVGINIDYSLYSPIKMLFFKDVIACHNALGVISNLGNILAVYSTILDIAKKDYQEGILNVESLFNDFIRKRIPQEHLTTEYLKKIEDAFEFIEALQIDSIFLELKKQNLSV